ncbi:hypothetical protein V7149_00315 [Bacillus sp. JJ1503]|uniref:hypothetical protein n=1 Tax=Bacillus sp. JJ1503 TaxID=3122956 RepID=UPI002FFD8D1B
MKQQAIEKATQYIEAMAAKLGVAAEHVYGLMVRQQIADGVVAIVGYLAFLAIGIAIILIARKYADYKDGNMATVIVLFGTPLFMIFALLFGAFDVLTAIKQLINPEYYAIKEILDALSGGK